MVRKTLLVTFALIAQPVSAKVTVDINVFTKKADKLIAKVEKAHGQSINALKPFCSTRTQQQDEKIEKEVYHRVLKLNRDPGFLKSFFFTTMAEEEQRCPFLWYHSIVNGSKRQVKQMKRRGQAKKKQFARKASQKKTTEADAQQYKKMITHVEGIVKKLEALEDGLIELSTFIKSSKAYTKELQSLPSQVAQPVYVVNPTYSIY